MALQPKQTPASQLPSAQLQKGPATVAAIPDALPRNHLAFEIAAKLRTPSDILAAYNLTQQQFRLLCRDPSFQMQLVEASREWASVKNIKERIRIKSAMAVEDSILDLFAIVKDPVIGVAARIDALKQLVTLSDMAPKPNAPALDTGRIAITINLGENPGENVITFAPTQEPAHAVDSDSTISVDTEFDA